MFYVLTCQIGYLCVFSGVFFFALERVPNKLVALYDASGAAALATVVVTDWITILCRKEGFSTKIGKSLMSVVIGLCVGLMFIGFIMHCYKVFGLTGAIPAAMVLANLVTYFVISSMLSADPGTKTRLFALKHAVSMMIFGLTLGYIVYLS